MYLDNIYSKICFVGVIVNIIVRLSVPIAGGALLCFKGVLVQNASEFRPNIENNIGETLHPSLRLTEDQNGYLLGCNNGCVTSLITVVTRIHGE